MVRLGDLASVLNSHSGLLDVFLGHMGFRVEMEWILIGSQWLLVS